MITEWIGWLGGDCPIGDEDTLVAVKFRTGHQYHDNAKGGSGFDWLHHEAGGDIVAYQVRRA